MIHITSRGTVRAMTDERARRQAIHEAGHAVAHVALGGNASHVLINYFRPTDRLLDCHDELVVIVAGAAAEGLMYEVDGRLEMYEDAHDRAYYELALADESDSEAGIVGDMGSAKWWIPMKSFAVQDRVLTCAIVDAVSLLRTHWSSVEALAGQIIASAADGNDDGYVDLADYQIMQNRDDLTRCETRKFTVDFEDRTNSRTVDAWCPAAAAKLAAGAKCWRSRTVTEYGGGAAVGGHDIVEVLMCDGRNRRASVYPAGKPSPGGALRAPPPR